MEVLYPCCCGLDVHKDSVVACLIRPSTSGGRAKEIRTFGTTTGDLLALAGWLEAAGCTHVAMESTGVYWKPVVNLLEGRFEPVVANASHIKNLPGRKTDVSDAEWIADLLQHGMIRASFIPSREQRELRDLTRTRAKLVDERSAAVRRVQQVLEDANIKLSGVATDIMGVSGRAILEALLAGNTDPELLADLAKGKLRKKRDKLEQALAGRVSDHHRLLLMTHLEIADDLDEAIHRLSAAIEEKLRPFEEEVARLDTIPGVGQRIAEIIIAEIGLDMTRFATSGHLASWAGMCPGNNESAGKRKGGKTRNGSIWLRRALTEAARAAARAKSTYLAAQYRQLVVRRGSKKAAIAVGHSILVIAYNLLRHRDTYRDLGPSYFNERRRARVAQRAIQQLHNLGYQVTIAPKEVAA
ncbi:MAG: IS110 family transposase [Anaerolineae bacterium]|nr:IS110 family transposase [Anaerolineae bacterium]